MRHSTGYWHDYYARTKDRYYKLHADRLKINTDINWGCSYNNHISCLECRWDYCKMYEASLGVDKTDK